MNTLLHKLLIPVAIILILSFLIVAVYIPAVVHENAVEQMTQSSVKTTQQFKTIRGYYTKNVVGKAKKFGMTPHFEHKNKDGYFPLPATMIHEISEVLKTQGTEVNLYSPFPFPNRANRQLDSFQDEAWNFLVKNPKETFVREVERGGKPYLRVAISDTMQAQGCVNCHNSHPDTPKNDWKLNDVRGVLEVVTPLTAVVDSSNWLSTKVIIILSISLAIALTALTLLFRRIVRQPLQNIESSINAIASGEADLNRKLEVESDDELGRISQSFNQFMDKMKNIVTNLVAVSDALRENAHNLKDMASSSTNFASQQRQESEVLATAINEMTASIAEIRESSAQAADSLDQVNDNVDTSNEETKQNVVAINTLSSDVSQVVGVIQELQEESRNIGAVLDVIKAIAEQTNLLALNAAIEAARAGEQGRGFAVVADEVRALAGRTQESTVEIQATVERLQQKAENATKVIDESSQHTSDCVDLSNSVSGKLNTAHDQVDLLAGLTHQIASAISEQTNVSNELDQNVVRLNDAACNILDELDKLKSLTDNLDLTANEIYQELGKFKV